jgi:hypothetical protein
MPICNAFRRRPLVLPDVAKPPVARTRQPFAVLRLRFPYDSKPRDFRGGTRGTPRYPPKSTVPFDLIGLRRSMGPCRAENMPESTRGRRSSN